MNVDTLCSQLLIISDEYVYKLNSNTGFGIKESWESVVESDCSPPSTDDEDDSGIVHGRGLCPT